ncbi:MAG: hypothetical protein WCI04_03205 [archaeon]
MGILSILFGKGAKSNVAKANAGSKSSDVSKSAVSSKPAEHEKNKAQSSSTAKEVSSKNSSKKKYFFLDTDYLLVAILIVIVLFGAKAYGFSISAPDLVIITDKAVFTVDLNNNSSSVANVLVSFYSPAKSSLSYPTKMAPNSSGKATITVYNTINKVQDITATVEAVVGEERVQKEVLLSFKENTQGSIAGAFTAFFSFGLFNKEVAAFSGVDWIVFWVLVIVAAILIIAFISRLAKRS